MTIKDMIIENESGHNAQELLDILPRENNKKRAFLIVNKLQGKHLPASPFEILAYFNKLGRKVDSLCNGERVLVVGFAETATAIGAAVAGKLANSFLSFTTREELPEEFQIVKFEEEHSHAINQALFLDLTPEKLLEFDRVVFVEDEITTGRTVLNFVSALNKSGIFRSNIKYTVAALICGTIDMGIFSEYNIDFCYLTRIDNHIIGDIFSESENICVSHKAETHKQKCNEFQIGDMPNVRLGIESSAYYDRLHDFISCCAWNYNFAKKDILVVGTEEFMHPAITLAAEIEKVANSVKTHSTTRSPIMSSDKYALTDRYELASPYNNERQTYLYNIQKYDVVLIITDASGDCSELINCLKMCGNNDVNIVRWQL